MSSARTSSFATAPHNLHRLRRGALNPFFSKRTIAQMEARILGKVEQLCSRFEQAIGTGDIIRLDAAYMALTMDIITEYAYGQCDNLLAQEDYNLFWKEAIIKTTSNAAFLRQFPWALSMMKTLPFPVLQRLDPRAGAMIQWQREVRRQIDSIIRGNREGKRSEGTIFQALLDSDLPPQEKTANRLQDEGSTLVAAGSETTAKSLSVITFYLLQDKAKLEKLRQELRTVIPTPDSPVSLTALEKLPYLVGLITPRCKTDPRLTRR